MGPLAPMADASAGAEAELPEASGEGLLEKAHKAKAKGKAKARLRKRNTDEQVSRTLKDNFKEFSAAAIESTRSRSTA